MVQPEKSGTRMIKPRDHILLDTHIWIWLMNGDQSLPHAIRQYIEKQIKAVSLSISIISIWEVGILVKKRRLTLPYHPLEWTNRALSTGIKLAELTPHIAIESSFLSELPKDPADRIIVATAKSLQATLITVDQEILKHAKHSFVSVFSG